VLVFDCVALEIKEGISSLFEKKKLLKVELGVSIQLYLAFAFAFLPFFLPISFHSFF
jgi:hypothetical protein